MKSKDGQHSTGARDPSLVSYKHWVFIGCHCRKCGGRSTLTIAIKKLFNRLSREWLCRHCHNVASLDIALPGR